MAAAPPDPVAEAAHVERLAWRAVRQARTVADYRRAWREWTAAKVGLERARAEVARAAKKPG